MTFRAARATLVWALALVSLAGCAGELGRGSSAEHAGRAAREAAERARIDALVAATRRIVAGEESAPRPQVLLLGTFHFANPGLDAHKPKYTFDVFSPRGQAEIEEVLQRLLEFAPTKVLVERGSAQQDGVDAWYRGYRDGNFPDNPNEILTIGFELARRLGHERVHGFDASGASLPSAPATSAELAAKAAAMGLADAVEPAFYARYRQAYAAEDEVAEQLTLRQRLRMMNHPDRLRLSHGAYFFWSGFQVADGTEFPGPDGFLSMWHNRNVRMFSTIQRLANAPGERVLVVVGAGHVPILQHCVQACPTLEWVPVDRYLAAH
jgi:hypothetical protein